MPQLEDLPTLEGPAIFSALSPIIPSSPLPPLSPLPPSSPPIALSPSPPPSAVGLDEVPGLERASDDSDQDSDDGYFQYRSDSGEKQEDSEEQSDGDEPDDSDDIGVRSR